MYQEYKGFTLIEVSSAQKVLIVRPVENIDEENKVIKWEFHAPSVNIARSLIDLSIQHNIALEEATQHLPKNTWQHYPAQALKYSAERMSAAELHEMALLAPEAALEHCLKRLNVDTLRHIAETDMSLFCQYANWEMERSFLQEVRHIAKEMADESLYNLNKLDAIIKISTI